ncbi:hypothetical protein [Saccharibacillus qingshengii]|uniref:hypothetical protein n=1 Tax=Saccharibacillus qingshengii TaxID=1763540 RepID=UPI001553DAC4|nr:hypothetical protein [Saccharibacillus qingshengii]
MNLVEVVDLIEGFRPNPLRSQDGALHADHLDSWVRSAAAFGILPKPAPELLPGFRLSGSRLEADPDTAELTLQLILHEARYHASAENIGPAAVLRALTIRLIEAGGLPPSQLGERTDEELLVLLRQHASTAEETARLLYRPHELRVAWAEGDAPSHAYRHKLSKLYLAVPRISNGQEAESLPSYPLIAEVERLIGEYLVFWEEEER